ncbi:phosphoribosyltransferase [Candidatus Micrarchaeota archaeon]|nr:phosphoribosyltransferase [Candidatus Micrarchaeota archaeon]
MKFEKIGWNEIAEDCKKLAKMVDDKPDLIVGLSRGGLVPARILSDILDTKMLVLGIRFYKGIGEKEENPVITQEMPKIQGKKILIVDDVADSGKSLVAAMEYLKGNELKAATLHYKRSSEYRPDYFVGTTDAWIIYPWEINEIERLLKSNGL